jgi:hypothetical protein
MSFQNKRSNGRLYQLVKDDDTDDMSNKSDDPFVEINRLQSTPTFSELKINIKSIKENV